jgi:hypothetical protein
MLFHDSIISHTTLLVTYFGSKSTKHVFFIIYCFSITKNK